jgi:hypothetical protein
MGSWVLPGVKRPGRGVEYSPISSAEVKERVELYLYSPRWSFMACSRVNVTLSLLPFAPVLPQRFALLTGMCILVLVPGGKKKYAREVWHLVERNFKDAS